MPDRALKTVASKYHLTVQQVRRILELLEASASIPYILRYHKDLAANLQPDDFYELIEERDRLEKLEARRRKIVKKLAERELLTPELQERIEQAADMQELIDHYVPFRPRKRSRARLALAQGLGKLATEVLHQEVFIPDMRAAAEPYVNAAEQGIETVEAVLEGVFHVVFDWVAEEKSHRDRQREVMWQQGEIVASRAARSLPGRLVREYKPYFSFREKVAKLHPYHFLMIQRGKQQRALDYTFEPPVQAMQHAAAELYLAGGAQQFDQVLAEMGALTTGQTGEELGRLNGLEFLVAAIKYSIENILSGIVAREADKDFAKRAEKLALEIVRRNVRALLMTRPLKERVLGIHPGYRTGCNLAVLDQAGNVLETTTVYPHLPQSEREAAVATLCAVLEKHAVNVIAIGHGTGLEETVDLISQIVADRRPEARYTVLPELGLETYSTSRTGRSELPVASASERVAAAVARRLLDPLSELVKIGPRQLCPGPYADDVNGGQLKQTLDRTIEDCVCSVGVDLNQAHQSLLRYLPGLDPDKALEIVAYREKNGPFKSRAQLREVPKIDEASYERAAGFVRVAGSENPLDVTRIHPRFYPAAEQICRQLGIELASLATEEGRAKLKERRSEVQLAQLEKDHEVHYLLLKDILDEMIEPWPDPRANEAPFVLRQRPLTLDDLEPDQWLDGMVRNIVDFGVFVDVGVGEDGLIHISELSDGYVETPYDVVCVGDRVRVRVVRVEQERKRIALSLREHSERREQAAHPRRRREQRPEHLPAEAAAVAAPAATADAKAAAPVAGPSSTVGWESRRVQRAVIGDRLSKTQQQILKRHEPEAKAAEPAPAPEPKPEEPQPEKAGEPGKVEGLSGLLKRLDFANIERRGKPTD